MAKLCITAPAEAGPSPHSHRAVLGPCSVTQDLGSLSDEVRKPSGTCNLRAQEWPGTQHPGSCSQILLLVKTYFSN